MSLTFEDISRSTHSINLNMGDTQRIAKEQAQIILTQNLREFLKVENILYGKYENMEIMTHEELVALVNKAYSKIVLRVDL